MKNVISTPAREMLSQPSLKGFLVTALLEMRYPNTPSFHMFDESLL